MSSAMIFMFSFMSSIHSLEMLAAYFQTIHKL